MPLLTLRRFFRVMLLAAVAAFPQVGAARVFTPREGGVASLENPESFGGKLIYSGHFRVNGCPSELKLISAPVGAVAMARLFREEFAGKVTWGATLAGAPSGSVRVGRTDCRFLIASAGDPASCLIFLMDGQAGARPGPECWPGALPLLDPLQQAELVVEHPREEFVFAAVSMPGGDGGLALASAVQRMVDDGWRVQPGAESAAHGRESGFALLLKKGKACWVAARSSASAHRVTITLLLKSDSTAMSLPPLP